MDVARSHPTCRTDNRWTTESGKRDIAELEADGKPGCKHEIKVFSEAQRRTGTSGGKKLRNI